MLKIYSLYLFDANPCSTVPVSFRTCKGTGKTVGFIISILSLANFLILNEKEEKKIGHEREH